ncbi:hypothetical protein Q2K19_31940 [Micromonospora soli]|uniref:hypothetical protein n=1 Tax=Micromonospora sp. NBRC 110009 TaxID=3061627 RepID=UPI002672CB07|nr:hypothetical protein [Micromonospora sp. NBRC 110009]WKT98700.1 hypothetical protein Q2K19_31940 [Micromonospora sp. NBRC 110009]
MFSAVMVLWGMFTVGQALWLNANGSTRQAQVVDVQHHIRSSTVRVQLADTGDEVNLWAWSGEPKVGTTMTVVYNESHNWAKDARAFAPTGRLWSGFGIGLWALCFVWVPVAWRRWRGTDDEV